jgi:hypothetical protein
MQELGIEPLGRGSGLNDIWPATPENAKIFKSRHRVKIRGTPSTVYAGSKLLGKSLGRGLSFRTVGGIGVIAGENLLTYPYDKYVSVGAEACLQMGRQSCLCNAFKLYLEDHFTKFDRHFNGEKSWNIEYGGKLYDVRARWLLPGVKSGGSCFITARRRIRNEEGITIEYAWDIPEHKCCAPDDYCKGIR